MKTRLLVAAVIALAATPASAACTWEWLCNGDGSCKQMPVCDSVYDVPTPRPDMQPPAMGVLTCEHIMRKGKSGRWYWHEACFCTDPKKGHDPSAPFANIVRCESPWKEAEAPK